MVGWADTCLHEERFKIDMISSFMLKFETPQDLTFGYQDGSRGEHFFVPLGHEAASHDARAN